MAPKGCNPQVILSLRSHSTQEENGSKSSFQSNVSAVQFRRKGHHVHLFYCPVSSRPIFKNCLGSGHHCPYVIHIDLAGKNVSQTCTPSLRHFMNHGPGILVQECYVITMNCGCIKKMLICFAEHQGKRGNAMKMCQEIALSRSFGTEISMLMFHERNPLQTPLTFKSTTVPFHLL